MSIRIGLISDTHSWLDPKLLTGFLKDVDEVWHAGDIGTIDVLKQLQDFKPLRAISGNIDDNTPVGEALPADLEFEVAGLRVWMIHIGGYPGRYPTRVKQELVKRKPGLFICGHSHILKIIPDQVHGLLHINPGACGREGFHRIRTAVRFEVSSGKISNLEVAELGLRGAIE
jgi:uncharacterized protein